MLRRHQAREMRKFGLQTVYESGCWELQRQWQPYIWCNVRRRVTVVRSGRHEMKLSDTMAFPPRRLEMHGNRLAHRVASSEIQSVASK
eukprot:3259133-Pyramimonas_sp.AAC.1